MVDRNQGVRGAKAGGFLNHPQPSIPKTAPQTQNVKSSEVLRRSSCRRRVNLTCDSASHLRERTVVGRSTEHQYQPSVDVPSHHPLLVRSSTYILFHCIVLLRLMVTHFHCIVLLRFSFASSFSFVSLFSCSSFSSSFVSCFYSCAPAYQTSKERSKTTDATKEAKEKRRRTMQ